MRLHKKGVKIMQIVAMTGLNYPPARAAIDCFEAGLKVGVPLGSPYGGAGEVMVVYLAKF